MGLLFLAKKPPILCHSVGWLMVKGWKMLSSCLPWLLGKSAESKLVWKLLGATQSRYGFFFFIGLRHGVQDATAVWLTNPAQRNLFCLGRPRTSSCRTLSALGARLCGIPSPAGNSAKLIRAMLGNNEISRLIWPDSRTSTEASAPVGVA